MVRIGGVNDPTNQKRTPLENELLQQHNNEESLVDKNQIQQWVDRAIGSFPSQGTRETDNQQSWPLSTTAATTTTTTTFPDSTNLLPTFAEDDALQSHNKSHLDDASSPSLLTAILDNPNTTQSDFDKAFAAELNQLTFQEREKTWDEIHGVAPIQEETQEFVRTKLVELQQVIYDTPLDQKQCYLEALNDPESRFYVTSFRFAIQFLRAERFNVHLAAKRLLLCCEKRVQFFGRQTLRRPLCLSDLNAEEQQTLKGGAFQVLSQRDRSGRLVVIDTSLCGPKLYTSLYAYYKCFWYIIMSVIEDDEETQKRGIVAIVWWMHHPLRLDQDFDNDLRQETIASLNWLPMRPYSSTHVCIDYNHSTMKQILARFMMAVSPKNMRYGIQLHRGTYTEVLYKLLTYGVPVDCIPVSSSGMVKTKNFARWIQRQRQKEEYLLSSSHSSSNKNRKKMMTTKKNRVVGDDHDSTPIIVQNNNPVAGWFSEDRIDLPSNRDVLLGTGKPLMKHPGNQNYRMIVDNLLQVYDSTPSLRDKAEVTWGVVRYIQENQGGRFLKRDTDSDWWQVVSQQEARDKTGKAFVNQRDSRKKKRPATTGHTTTATTSTKEKAGGTTSSSIAGCGTPTATNPATSTRPPTSSMMRFTNMTLREKESTTTADTAIPQSTTTIGTGEQAMVWGSSFLPMMREARSTLIPLYNETTTGTGTIGATSGSGGSSHKKRRYDHDDDDGGGGMSSSSSSLSNSCFGWCGGGGGGTTRTSSTATLSSTSFLDGSR